MKENIFDKWNKLFLSSNTQKNSAEVSKPASDVFTDSQTTVESLNKPSVKNQASPSFKGFCEYLSSNLRYHETSAADICAKVKQFTKFLESEDMFHEESILDLLDTTKLLAYLKLLDQKVRNKLIRSKSRHTIVAAIRHALRYLASIDADSNGAKVSKIYSSLSVYFQGDKSNVYSPYIVSKRSHKKVIHAKPPVDKSKSPLGSTLRKEEASLVQGYDEFIETLQRTSFLRTGAGLDGSYGSIVRVFLRQQVSAKSELLSLQFDCVADPARIDRFIQLNESLLKKLKATTLANRYDTLKKSVNYVKERMASRGEVNSASKNPDHCLLLLSRAADLHRSAKNLESKERATVERAKVLKQYLTLEQFTWLHAHLHDRLNELMDGFETKGCKKMGLLVEFQNYLLCFMFMTIPTQRLRVIAELTSDMVDVVSDSPHLRITFEKSSSTGRSGSNFVARVVALNSFLLRPLKFWVEKGRNLMNPTPGKVLWLRDTGSPLKSCTISERVQKLIQQQVFMEYNQKVFVGPQSLRKLYATHALNQMFKHASLNSTPLEKLLQMISGLARDLGHTSHTLMNDYYLKDISTMTARSVAVSKVTGNLLWKDELDTSVLNRDIQHYVATGIHDRLGLKEETISEIEAVYELFNRDGQGSAESEQVHKKKHWKTNEKSYVHSKPAGLRIFEHEKEFLEEAVSFEEAVEMANRECQEYVTSDSDFDLAELAERDGRVMIQHPAGELEVSYGPQSEPTWTCVIGDDMKRTLLPYTPASESTEPSTPKKKMVLDCVLLSSSPVSKSSLLFNSTGNESEDALTSEDGSAAIIVNSDDAEMEMAQVGDIKIANHSQIDFQATVSGIKSGEWLSSSCFDIMFQMLRCEFPNVEMDVDFGKGSRFRKSGRSKQCYVVHNGSDHWLAFCVSSQSLMLFDSGLATMGQTLGSRVRDKIYEILGKPVDRQVVQMPMQRQQGGSDCGLFAIAVCVEFLYGRQPSECHWDQSKMRSHLVGCMEKGRITPFPKKSGGSSSVLRGPMKPLRFYL